MLLRRREARGTPGRRRSVSGVDGWRDERGKPSGRIRLAALVLVLGLVGATAPVVVGPLAGRLWHALTDAVPGP